MRAKAKQCAGMNRRQPHYFEIDKTQPHFVLLSSEFGLAGPNEREDALAAIQSLI